MKSIVGLSITCCAALLPAHGDLHKRIAQVSEKIRSAPRSASLYVQRGELHRLHRDWPAARRDFTTARGLRPDLPELDFREGRMESQAGQPILAIRFLSAQLRSGPHVLAYLWRGRSFAARGRLGAALRDYDAALAAVKSPNADHYLERARLQMRMQQPPCRVVEGLDDGIARLGPLVSLQVLALELEVQSGNWGAALRRIDRTLPGLPLKSPWLLRRGDVLRRMRRPEAARRDYDAGVRELSRLRRTNAVQASVLRRLREALDQLDRER